MDSAHLTPACASPPASPCADALRRASPMRGASCRRRRRTCADTRRSPVPSGNAVFEAGGGCRGFGVRASVGRVAANVSRLGPFDPAGKIAQARSGYQFLADPPADDPGPLSSGRLVRSGGEYGILKRITKCPYSARSNSAHSPRWSDTVYIKPSVPLTLSSWKHT
jgi:hypothetical protein